MKRCGVYNPTLFKTTFYLLWLKSTWIMINWYNFKTDYPIHFFLNIKIK